MYQKIERKNVHSMTVKKKEGKFYYYSLICVNQLGTN